MPRPRSWTHEVLLSAARLGDGPVPPRPAAGRPGGLPDGDETWEGLAMAARAHGIQGWLARRLRGQEGVPHDFQVRLQAAAARIAGGHRRMLGVAADALAVLDRVGAG
ncbi:MAG: hypothetical protein M3217_07780, partial [Actinomycetota bacterium]|nr:hypothetical protein [Actinomycetota bacterium]